VSVFILLLQLICGGVGGLVSGSMSSHVDLGARRNWICGMLGGGIGGQILQHLSTGDFYATDMQIFLCSVIGGVLGGFLFVAIVGFIAGRIRQRP